MIKTVHRTLAFALLLFVVMHMLTHLSGLWGIETYNQVQTAFRKIYHIPIIEFGILAGFCAQVILGSILLYQNWRRLMRTVWGRVQGFSGILVLFFLSQHIPALVITRFVTGMDTNFYWPASVTNGAPFVYYFVPYYVIGVVAFFVHMACFARLALIRVGSKKVARHLFWGISFFGLLVAVLIVAMLTGVFYDVNLPDEWVGYLQSYLPSYEPKAR